MNICKLLLPVSALMTVTLAAAAAFATADQKPTPAPGGAQQPRAEQGKAVEAAMPRLAPEHSQLQKLVGTWDATVTCTMPGQPAATSTGTATYKPIGETWVMSEFKGEMNGKPFVGHGLDGFDTDKQKFVSIWVSSLATNALVSEGTQDAATKTTTLTGECNDPATGQPVTHRMTCQMKDNDTMTFTMNSTGADGKEVGTMKIEYKRRK